MTAPNYGEYTTVSDLRSGGYLDITTNAADGLLLTMIRSTSRDIDQITNRHFFPVNAVHSFDCPGRSPWGQTDWLPQYKSGGIEKNTLRFDDDLLTVSALTNGDGNIITNGQYLLSPYNAYPKRHLGLLPTASVWFQPSNAGEFLGVLKLDAVWGYHENYLAAWQVGTVLTTGGLTTSATTHLVATGTLKAGHLTVIDSEYAYVNAVVAASPNDTITLTRGVNGSSAAQHAANAAVNVWQIQTDLEMLTRTAAAAKYKLRANPTQETVVVAGMTFSTPKDIHKYLEQNLDELGLSWPGWG